MGPPSTCGARKASGRLQCWHPPGRRTLVVRFPGRERGQLRAAGGCHVMRGVGRGAVWPGCREGADDRVPADGCGGRASRHRRNEAGRRGADAAARSPASGAVPVGGGAAAGGNARLAASLPPRDMYRRALGVPGRKLVAVTSTWGPGSLLQRHRDLLPRLIHDLPRERYRVAAIVHPNVWHWHGPRQLIAWYADCVRRGLILVPPQDGWRGVLAASDVVIGDHGAVTCYAAAAGVPVLLASYPDEEVEPGSPVSVLAQAAPRVSSWSLTPGRSRGGWRSPM